MTQQLTRPPAHVWDKIAKILDEQEYEKKNTNKLISNTFRIHKKTRRTNYVLVTVAGVSLLSLIMLNFPPASKN
jgi:hypothetical protein